jgi:hypothetical protein
MAHTGTMIEERLRTAVRPAIDQIANRPDAQIFSGCVTVQAIIIAF